MKVINDNRPENRFTYPFLLTCSNCKSELEVEKGDVKAAHGNEFTNTSAHFYVACPVCHAHNRVTPKPPRTQAQITEDYYNK